MAYIPKNARWFIAEVVVRIRVAGDRRDVVHANFLLVRADTPARAYVRACALGRAEEMTYRNPAGKKVTARFLGLRELHVVHDELEDGAELLFEEHVGISTAAARSLVRPRSKLAVFRPIERSPKPDYASGEVVVEAKKLAADLRRRVRTRRRA
jgi:hypothetical protein